MSKISALVLTLLCFSIPTALAQDTTQTQSKSYSVGTVEVKYVAGTKKPELLSGMGKMGCLLTSGDNRSLVFVSYNRSWRWRGWSRFVHLVNPAWSKGHCPPKKKQEVANGQNNANSQTAAGTFSIPYSQIKILARGQVLSGTANGGSGTTTLVTLIGGVGGLVTAVEKLSGPALAASASAAGATVAITGTAYLNRRTLNYIAIFFTKDTGKPALSSLTLSTSGAPVFGGGSAVGKVALSGKAPSGGAEITLLTDDPAIVHVPDSVTIRPGTSTASFFVRTETVQTLTAVTVTAENKDESITQKADLIVAPPNYPTGLRKAVPPQSTASPPASPDPFKECSNAGGCEVAVFQVIDPHDFWNTVEFLSARTGRQFILETDTAPPPK